MHSMCGEHIQHATVGHKCACIRVIQLTPARSESNCCKAGEGLHPHASASVLMSHRLNTLYPSSTASNSSAILIIDVIRILEPAVSNSS